MLIKFLINKYFKQYSLAIKFILVGLLNTLFGYSVYLLCLFIGLNYAIAALLSTIVGIVFNFFTTGRLVFNSKNNFLFFKFIFVYFIIYLFTISGLSILNFYEISYEIGGAILIIPNAILAFFLNKKLVFNYEKNY